MYYMYFGTTQSRQLEYCHHQLPNEAKAEINYTPPQHNNKVFSFHFVCGKRVLIWSDRHYCRPLCSISTQEGVEELFFQLYQVLGSLAHFWLELLSSSLTIVTGRHFNPKIKILPSADAHKISNQSVENGHYKSGNVFVSCSF